MEKYDSKSNKYNFSFSDKLTNKEREQLSAKKVKIIRKIDSDISQEPDDFHKMILYILKLSLNPKTSPHIVDFLADLVMFTTISYEQLNEILHGAYVIIKEDKGYFYKKFKKFNYMLVSYLDGSSHKSYHKEQARIGKGSISTLNYKEFPNDSVKNQKKINKIGKKSDNFDILIGTILNSSFLENITNKQYSSWFQFEEARGTTILGYPTIHSWGHWKSSINYGYDKLSYTVKKNLPKRLTNNSNHTVKNLGALGKSIYTDNMPLIINICVDKLQKKKRRQIKNIIQCERYKQFKLKYINI